MRRLILAPLALTAFALTSVAPAQAVPGLRLPAWLAWAKTTPVLQPFKPVKDEMSGGTLYTKDLRADGLHLYFSAEAASGAGAGSAGATADEFLSENLAVLDVPNGYDLRRHRDIALRMARAVYGAAIATDLQHATVAGDFAVFDSPSQRLTILKGKRFAYQLSGPSLNLFELKHLKEGLANAKTCASEQCGD